MSKTLNLKLGWMKFCNDMNQKRCASKNVLTRNLTKMQKSEKRKIKIPPTMIRTSFFNTKYEWRHIENRKRKAKPKSQIPPTINSVTDSRYRITSAPLSAATFAFHVSEFEIRLSRRVRTDRTCDRCSGNEISALRPDFQEN